MKLYVIAGRGGGVQETSITTFGQWELLSIHNISSVASEPERAAEARSAVVASYYKRIHFVLGSRSERRSEYALFLLCSYVGIGGGQGAPP